MNRHPGSPLYASSSGHLPSGPPSGMMPSIVARTRRDRNLKANGCRFQIDPLPACGSGLYARALPAFAHHLYPVEQPAHHVDHRRNMLSDNTLRQHECLRTTRCDARGGAQTVLAASTALSVSPPLPSPPLSSSCLPPFVHQPFHQGVAGAAERVGPKALYVNNLHQQSTWCTKTEKLKGRCTKSFQCVWRKPVAAPRAAKERS
jgi:hypothetical protein